MRKIHALATSLVLLLVLSATAHFAQGQRPDGPRAGAGGSGGAGAGPGDERKREPEAIKTQDEPAHSGVGGGGSKGAGTGKSGRGIRIIPAPSEPSVKVDIKRIEVLECPDCGENAVVAVKGKPVIEYRCPPPAAVPEVRAIKAVSCVETEQTLGGVWLKAKLKLKSGTKFSEGNVDFVARTFDCCNPISVQYTPLAEDACDVLSDVKGQRSHKCFGGEGSRKVWGCSRPHSTKTCVKANTLTTKSLETLLVGFPDAADIPVGCKQTEGLFVDGNTGDVLGCLRVKWSVCVGDNCGDCGTGDSCGCGDSDVFNNPRCGRCLQSRAERLGICADFLNFAQAPADTCEWRECCCDADSTGGGTPCSTGNVGSCDDKSCRRPH